MSRRRGSAYSAPKLKLKPKTIIAVATVISFIAAGLSVASLVTESVALSFWRELIFSIFGWMSFMAPVIFLIVGLVLHKVKWQFAQTNVLLGLILVIISLVSMSAPLKPEAAGGLGLNLWNELSSFISKPGALIMLLGVFVVGLVVLFNTSLAQIFHFLGLMGNFIKVKIFEPIFNRPKTFEAKNIAIKLSGVSMSPVAAERPIVNSKSAPKTAVSGKDDVIISDELVQNMAGSNRVWKYPPLSLLSDKVGSPAQRGDVKKSASVIEKTLESFGVQARVAEVNGGPAVTQYALEIAAGTKIAKIANLQNDIALALATPTGTVRVEAPIPGKSLVGIEVPNNTLEVVGLKQVLASEEMKTRKSKLAVGMGRDTASKPMIVDIDRMPHGLIAGTTGSGKSVMMNAIIASLLFRNSPDELKLILIDPKRVEMSSYNGIPHLLTPVITEPEKIVSALKWAMAEMDRRYKLFQQVGVRNITGYNEMSGFQALPYIVIMIDELADLMMFAPVEVEDAITRIAQLARATGIHLIVATQRPSVDVITGLIKANIPCRMAFNVSSMMDSRVILDTGGAEKLLGRGDMLFLPPDASKPVRIQGVFVQDGEINNLIKFLKDTGIAPQYTAEITEMPIGKLGKGGGMSGGGADDQDDLFQEAVKTVCQYDRASASLLQRRLRVGYARAARIIDELESAGVIGPGEGAKPREVLVRNAQEYLDQGAAGDSVES
jgi:DNA segregation ATPase FtsK/SpoIIIE, S-DNA-T family